jgi:hypothetical protein
LNQNNNISNEKLLEIIHKLNRDGITKSTEQSEIIEKEYGVEIAPHIVSELKYRDKIKRYGLKSK